MSVVRFTVRRGHDPHVHVAVRSGTEAQAEWGQLPLAGSLVLTPEDWEGLRRVLEAGMCVPRSEPTAVIEIR